MADGVQALARLETLVARALRDPDPVAALRSAAQDEGLPPELRRALLGADPDGVGISALLVVRLRFERLLHGSQRAGEWFELDPAEFASAFKDYHDAVEPTAALPSGEAKLFEAWLDDRDG